MKVMMVVPELIGSQVCHVGPKLLEGLNVGLGAPCKVVCGDVTCVSYVWPRQDASESHIQLDPVVCSEATGPRHTASCEVHVTPVAPCIGHHLHVTVAMDNSSLAVRHQHEPSRHSKIITYIQNIVRNLTLAPGYIVRSHLMELGQLYGIPYILINGTSGKEGRGLFVMVQQSIGVTIDRVMSQDTFLQRHKHKLQGTRLAGIDGPLHTLRSIARLALVEHEQLQQLGIDATRGILLRGPPGCGKTSVVKLLAEEFDAHLLCVEGNAITGSRPGESEGTLREIFKKAVEISQEAPCIVLLDEVDAVCPQKGRSSLLQESRIVTQVVGLIDQLQKIQARVLVIGATNRPCDVDSSLRRPGRLEKEIFIGIPSLQQREEILSLLTASIKLHHDVSLPELAESTPGYVGADLVALVQQALCTCLADREVTEMEECVGWCHFQAALHTMTPSTQRSSDILVDHRPVSWEDIGGLQKVKAQIQQAVEWPLKHPESFARLGIPRPRGVLLYGPPGCAKTMLVRAAASACHVTFLAISGAQLYSPFVGDSERKISEVFQQARAGAPSILFIDEIDSVIGSRSHSSKHSSVQQKVLSTLLNEMDGVGLKVADLQRATTLLAAGDADSCSQDAAAGGEQQVDNSDVLVVAASNRPDMVDEALIRPGRFDRIIYVPLPDREARQQILEVHTRKMPLQDVDLSAVADVTEGYTGADLENLCREAALYSLSNTGLDASMVRHDDYMAVLQYLEPSLTPRQLLQYTSAKYSHQ